MTPREKEPDTDRKTDVANPRRGTIPRKGNTRGRAIDGRETIGSVRRKAKRFHEKTAGKAGGGGREEHLQGEYGAGWETFVA